MKYCIIKITPEDLERGAFGYIDITKENLLCVKDRLKEGVEAYNNIIQYTPVLLCSENGRGLYELMKIDNKDYPFFILDKETYEKHCIFNKLEELAVEIAEDTGYLVWIDDLMEVVAKVLLSMCKSIDLSEAIYDPDIINRVKGIVVESIHKSEKQHCQKNENNKGTITEDGSGDCQR